ncbi:MAG: hypothetical protein JNK65_05400, partial [Deltaproteobacteria bacterium]|nr:hypothetical protein [Deltaproteobacteria bacterium]
MPTSRIQGPPHNSEISSDTVSPQRSQRRSSEKPLNDVQRQRQEIQRRLTQRYDQYREIESRESAPDFDESEVDEVSDEVGAGNRSEGGNRSEQDSQAHQMNSSIIKKQARELQALVRSSGLTSDDKDRLREEIAQILEDQASQSISFEESIDSLAGIKDQIIKGNQEVLAETSQEIASQVSELKSDLAELKSSGHLSEEQTNQYKQTADALVKDVKSGKLSGKSASEAMKKLKADINGVLKANFEGEKSKLEDLKAQLNGGMDHVSALRSGWAHEKANQLASLIKNAMRNNSWSAVESTLNFIPKNDSNNVVQYLVGGIYKQVGKDETKLMEVLSLIPKSVREKMIQKVVEDVGELNSAENT